MSETNESERVPRQEFLYEQCIRDGCEVEGTPPELRKHLKNEHGVENDKINGKIEIECCPCCKSEDILAKRGGDTSDICIECFECGKFTWVESRPPNNSDYEELLGETGTTEEDGGVESLLNQLKDELAEIDVPTERIDVEATYTGGADCTCGVCGEEKEFRETSIVDPEKFEYSDWDTEAIEELHKPLNQQRLCRDCERKFIQNGGEFPHVE